MENLLLLNLLCAEVTVANRAPHLLVGQDVVIHFIEGVVDIWLLFSGIEFDKPIHKPLQNRMSLAYERLESSWHHLVLITELKTNLV